MSRLWRVFCALFMSLALLVAIAPPAGAKSSRDELRSALSASIVQISTVITGQVLMEFIPDKIWSEQVSIRYTQAGFAVDDRGTIVSGGSPFDVADEWNLQLLRDKALDIVAERLNFEPSRTEYLKGISKGLKWKVAESESNPDAPPKAEIKVRSIGEGSPVIGEQGATLVALQPIDRKARLALIRATGDSDGLTPLPIATETPQISDEVTFGSLSGQDFSAALPQLMFVDTTVTSVEEDALQGSRVKFAAVSPEAGWGGPVLDADGVIQGVIINSDPSMASTPEGLREFLTANDVEPTDAAAEDEGTSLWLWLGPALGVLGLLLLGGIVFFIVRRGRKKRALAGVSQQFHAQQFGAQQFGTHQFGTQPHAAPPHSGAPQQYGGRQTGDNGPYGNPQAYQSNPNQVPPFTANPQAPTPPPSAPQGPPAGFDQTQVAPLPHDPQNPPR